MKGIYRAGEYPNGRCWVEIEALDGTAILGDGWSPLDALTNAQIARGEYDRGLRRLRAQDALEAQQSAAEVGGRPS